MNEAARRISQAELRHVKAVEAIKTIGKWALFIGLCSVGTIAFIVVAGESDELSLAEFVLCKLAAIAVMGACYLSGRVAIRHNAMPEWIIELSRED